MRQQVNLAAPMFRKQRALFSARVSLATTLLVTLTLALVYGAVAWRTAAVSAEQARLEQQREGALRRLNELAQQFQGPSASQALDAELAALTAERDRKASALAALARRDLGSTDGFSPHFIGLARQRLGGLWLTRVELSASGGEITLAGVTLSEELIPRYLRKLGGEPVFSGTQFQHAALERAAEGGALRFELRTQAAARGGSRP